MCVPTYVAFEVAEVKSWERKLGDPHYCLAMSTLTVGFHSRSSFAEHPICGKKEFVWQTATMSRLFFLFVVLGGTSCRSEPDRVAVQFPSGTAAISLGGNGKVAMAFTEKSRIGLLVDGNRNHIENGDEQANDTAPSIVWIGAETGFVAFARKTRQISAVAVSRFSGEDVSQPRMLDHSFGEGETTPHLASYGKTTVLVSTTRGLDDTPNTRIDFLDTDGSSLVMSAVKGSDADVAIAKDKVAVISKADGHLLLTIFSDAGARLAEIKLSIAAPAKFAFDFDDDMICLAHQLGSSIAIALIGSSDGHVLSTREIVHGKLLQHQDPRISCHAGAGVIAWSERAFSGSTSAVHFTRFQVPSLVLAGHTQFSGVGAVIGKSLGGLALGWTEKSGDRSSLTFRRLAW